MLFKIMMIRNEMVKMKGCDNYQMAGEPLFQEISDYHSANSNLKGGGTVKANTTTQFDGLMVIVSVRIHLLKSFPRLLQAGRYKVR